MHSEDPLADRDEVTDEEPEDDRGTGHRFMGWIGETLRTWGPALLVVLLIRSVVAEPFRIPSGSMVPTMEIGDHILVTKFSYGLRVPLTRIPIGELNPPQRGDIAVFVFPDSDDTPWKYYLDMPFPGVATYDYVKRIVGVPGDVMQVKAGVLYVNGEAQTREQLDPYSFIDDRCRKHPSIRYVETLDGQPHAVLADAMPHARMRDFGPKTVPEGHVFAMGDNRDNSSDSRVWGFVPLRNIKGKAHFVWLSYDRCDGDIPIFGSLRWNRFGQSLYGEAPYQP